MSEFVLDVAADLYMTKENLEVKFPERPTLGELRAKVESLFQTEATVQRPPGLPLQHVRIRRFQIYDDHQRRWSDLDSCSQLQPYAQLYAFQEGSDDVQGEIPPSSPPRSRISVPGASPHRERGYGTNLEEIRAEVHRSPRAMERLREEQQYNRIQHTPGESLIAQERQQEESKVKLDIDSHREMVRRETHDFLTKGN
eukprot:TRINITY_DN10867_c0_g1_i2.p1 TRINITY_DN10867_c0_g1~~TRINITY_DN10867_c0_g1_i2.p1  ORF type:complete len:198 (+),score=32.25 TRINITY_DN10867_c0_g1_i2:47-640(+)